jgi:hypothetical protein
MMDHQTSDNIGQDSARNMNNSGNQVQTGIFSKPNFMGKKKW